MINTYVFEQLFTFFKVAENTLENAVNATPMIAQGCLISRNAIMQ